MAQILWGQVRKYVFLVAFTAFVAMVGLARAVGGYLDAADAFTLGAFWLGVFALVGSVVWARGGLGRLGVRETLILGISWSTGSAILVVARVMKGTDVAEWAGLLGLVLFGAPLAWAALRLTVGFEGDD